MTPLEWRTIKHFASHEFDSPDAPGSGRVMSFAFVTALDKLREACGFAFVVQSGYRTIAHNAQLSGAVDGSAHTRGMAADIGAGTSGMKFKIVGGAFNLGFRRIGVGDRFIHLDMDAAKPQSVLWTY